MGKCDELQPAPMKGIEAAAKEPHGGTPFIHCLQNFTSGESHVLVMCDLLHSYFASQVLARIELAMTAM